MSELWWELLSVSTVEGGKLMHLEKALELATH